MNDAVLYNLDDVVSDVDDRARVGMIIDLVPDEDLYLVLWRGERPRTWIDGSRLTLVDDGTGGSIRTPRGRGGS